MSRNPQQHLTEEEFISFVLEELPEALEQEIDQHLEHCVACARKLEEFYATQEQFPEQAWAAQRNKFVATLRQQVLGTSPLWERLTTQLRDLVLSPSIALGAARASTSLLKLDGQREIEGGALRWRVKEDEEGNLIVRFGSHVLALENQRLRLRAGTWQSEIVLTRVAPDQVGAQTIISRDERAQLPTPTVLQADLILEVSETDQTNQAN